MRTTERRAKRMTGAWTALVLAAAMGGGCCLAPPRPPPPPPKSTQERSLQWVDPAPDGYYTGAWPNFAQRANPDPLGRKFRVAFLRIRLNSVDGKAGEEVKAVAQSNMRGLSTGYLPLRKREKDIARGLCDPGDNNAKGNPPRLEKAFFDYETSFINYLCAIAADSNKTSGRFRGARAAGIRAPLERRGLPQRRIGEPVSSALHDELERIPGGNRDDRALHGEQARDEDPFRGVDRRIAGTRQCRREDAFHALRGLPRSVRRDRRLVVQAVEHAVQGLGSDGAGRFPLACRKMTRDGQSRRDRTARAERSSRRIDPSSTPEETRAERKRSVA